VFTITQVTHLIAEAHSWSDYVAALLVLSMTWWMYGGYAWLTNNVSLREATMRIALLAGMAGFLVMALATPQAFGVDGLAFGLAYLLVVIVHAALFTRAVFASSARAIWRIAPFNLAAAGMLVAAGLTQGAWDWALWAGAVGVLIVSSVMQRESGFSLNPTHFAERHGLVVLIVLGESLVAVGRGIAGQQLDLATIIAALLGLALCAALWWSYFDRDDARAEHALTASDSSMRAHRALTGYGYGHLLLIAGIVVMAVGVTQIFKHLQEQASTFTVWHLGGGMALYLAGDAIFRDLVGIGRTRLRWMASLAALLSLPIGLLAGGLAQMFMLITIMVVMLALEQHTLR
jgi:low temperature requirement protein LtrA